MPIVGGNDTGQYMPPQIQAALGYAKQGRIACPPNPSVGCVITSADGTFLGGGHTQAVGSPHAEIMALRDSMTRGHLVTGCTAYVTLEPCSHQGRTGPCCDALISAGIKKVVASIADPNPLVSGKGFDKLRAAGVEVEVLDPAHPFAIESRELNIGFFSRMVRKTPWVRLKVAMSLDGKTALPNGSSQWITSDAARADGHTWRARACAILTGIGTVLQDNPRLDVRYLDTPRQPHLVIVDSKLQTPTDAAVFSTPRKVYIYTATKYSDKQRTLEALGATVICLPNAQGKVDLSAMLLDLGTREINELHVEAGSKLNGSFLDAGLVDEILLYMAPKLLGDGMGLAQMGQIQDLVHAPQLEYKSVETFGPDLRVLARFSGRDAF